MKYIVLGFVLWFALYMPSSADSAEGAYRIVTLKEKAAASNDAHWRACGNYFASAESTEGKIVHFNFEKRSAGKLSVVFAFSKIDSIIISIDERVRTPVVDIVGNRREMMFLISINSMDYKAGLPCLAKGIRI